jgi:two-component system chemotaxis response regulator CheB
MAQRDINNRYELLVIGGSAGSLDVLIKLLPALRKDVNIAIVIVLHRNDTESLLAEVLTDRMSKAVIDAEEKEPLQPGAVYIAPPDYHLLIEKDHTFSLDYSEKVNYSRPSIDVTFETAAEAYRAGCVGLLLSGANADGTNGLAAIKLKGGLTIVQQPAEAAMRFMPEYAIEHVQVDYVVTTDEMVAIINRLNS